MFAEVLGASRLLGKDLGTRFEQILMADLNRTLHLVNVVIPMSFRTAVAFVSQIRDLYLRRSHIDALALLRPSLITLFNEIYEWIRCRLYIDRRNEQLRLVQNRQTKTLDSVIDFDGLMEIQSNNMQEFQLKKVDQVMREELDVVYGPGALIEGICRSVNNRSVFDFVSDVWVTSRVMRDRKINHETYRKLQSDIGHVIRLGQAFSRNFRLGWRIMSTKTQALDVLKLPSFAHEQQEPAVSNAMKEFRSIVVKKVRFRYSLGVPFALDFEDELEFEAGKIYFIVGQNRSGKSTLVKLLLKLFNGHDEELNNDCEMYFNEVPFSRISRRELRSRLSYISQRPFIFEGTISQNISLAANPSPGEIREAAKLAGIFLMDSDRIDERTVERKEVTDIVNIKPWERNRREIRSFVASCGKFISDLFDVSSAEKPADLEDDIFNYAEQLFERLSLEKDTKANGQNDLLDMALDCGGSNVSGGFAQSIALARIFLRTSSDVIILDEALGQMDAIKKREFILPNLLEFARTQRKTLIMITHDMSVVEKLADEIDQIILMEGGKIVCKGKHHDLIKQNNNQQNQPSEYQRLFGI
eukprot:TRINITY_DN1021_c0_g1_i19.p1 TRINITY_DN1021_c0_g1~~TRINITY_DN1021_c0_g1_i19.p1  ORF type:complete len:585 (-),score=127.10 TRINITY_DN1021_c0_g1_i19:1474-3228(-)